MKGTPGWVLVYRKSGKTRRFASLEAARRVHVRAAARYGTRWLSLRPETPTNEPPDAAGREDPAPAFLVWSGLPGSGQKTAR